MFNAQEQMLLRLASPILQVGRGVLSGISPRVATLVVQLGMNHSLTTVATLQDALELALRGAAR